MPKDSTNNQKEISIALNAAVAVSLRPARLGPIPEGRLRKLHEIARALIAPAQELLEPLDEGRHTILEPEELVAVLAVAALYVQLHDVMKTGKLPFGGLAKEVFDVTA